MVTRTPVCDSDTLAYRLAAQRSSPLRFHSEDLCVSELNTGTLREKLEKRVRDARRIQRKTIKTNVTCHVFRDGSNKVY